MNLYISKAWLALLWVSSIGLLSQAVSAQVRVESTSQALKNGSFSWRIFVPADATTLSNITCVEYQLDPSFLNPNRRVCTLGDSKYPFAVSGEALKGFKVGVTVRFKDRSSKYVEHDLRLSQEIAVTQQIRVKTNSSKVLDRNPFFNQVAVYVSGGNAKSYRLKIYENGGAQRALFEQMSSDNVTARFNYKGQPYVLRGYTRGVLANFELYCTVYREVIR